jgi:hypothetical protein
MDAPGWAVPPMGKVARYMEVRARGHLRGAGRPLFGSKHSG